MPRRTTDFCEPNWAKPRTHYGPYDCLHWMSAAPPYPNAAPGGQRMPRIQRSGKWICSYLLMSTEFVKDGTKSDDIVLLSDKGQPPLPLAPLTPATLRKPLKRGLRWFIQVPARGGILRSKEP